MSRIADDRYYELDTDTVEYFGKLINDNIALPPVNYKFIGDRKAKDLIKVSKIADKFAYLLDSPILIEINQLMFDDLSSVEDEAMLILFKEAFSSISIDEASGKAKTKNNTFVSSKDVLSNYEFSIVDRAHKLQEELLEQIKDEGREVQIDEINIGE